MGVEQVATSATAGTTAIRSGTAAAPATPDRQRTTSQPKQEVAASKGVAISTPGDGPISAVELLGILSAMFGVETQPARLQPVMSELQTAVGRGQVYQMVEGAVEIAGVRVLPFGNGLSSSEARDLVFRSAAAQRAMAEARRAELEATIATAYERQVAHGETPTPQPEAEAEVEQIKAQIAQLSKAFDFRGSDVAVDEKGEAQLGPFSISFGAWSQDKEGRRYQLQVTASGGGGQDLSFRTAGFDITM